jgi:hypothetical protein
VGGLRTPVGTWMMRAESLIGQGETPEQQTAFILGGGAASPPYIPALRMVVPMNDGEHTALVESHVHIPSVQPNCVAQNSGKGEVRNCCSHLQSVDWMWLLVKVAPVVNAVPLGGSWDISHATCGNLERPMSKNIVGSSGVRCRLSVYTMLQWYRSRIKQMSTVMLVPGWFH